MGEGVGDGGGVHSSPRPEEFGPFGELWKGLCMEHRELRLERLAHRRWLCDAGLVT